MSYKNLCSTSITKQTMIHLTEPGSRHGDDETSNIAEVTHVVGLDQRQEDVVVLLTLVLVHGCDLVGLADQRVVSAPGNSQVRFGYVQLS
jgi:hypothetical protein